MPDRVLRPLPEVFLQVRPLLPGARPAFVVRDDESTLLVIDALCSRLAAVEFCVEHLTTEELNRYRAAFGQPPVGLPLSDSWMLDELMPVEVPDELRLPCFDAIYELQRMESEAAQSAWYARFGRYEWRSA